MDCRVRRATPYDIASMITIETASYPEPWGSDQFTGLLDEEWSDDTFTRNRTDA